jgi:uncharacterized membrane protein
MEKANVFSRESILFKVGKYVIGFILVVGIFLRFYNLDGKIYWRDEVFTSLQISGHLLDVAEHRELFTGELVSQADIAEYQYVNSDTSYADTINGLKEFEPQLTPFYFVLARGWNSLLGNSTFINRLLTAFISLLCLPFVFWLGLQLFEKSTVAWVATAFVAVSPFQILYAQEARPYSLWVLTTLISSVLLLRAQQQANLRNWLLYSVSIVASLYTFLFAITTLFAHGLYILLSERDKISRVVLMYVGAALASLVAFGPWLLVIINDPPSNYAAVPHGSLLAYPKGWLRNLSLSFADFGINDASSKVALLAFLGYLLLLVTAIAYSYIYLQRFATKKTFWFLTCLLIVPFLMLLAYDFGKGGQLTTRGSYLIPSLLSLQMTFGYLMASQCLQMKRFWIFACLFFLSVSTVSSFVLVSSNTWWHKADENIHHEVAAIINQAESPLVISDVEFSLPISLSHSLTADTQYILLPPPDADAGWQLPKIPDGNFSDIFLYRPSELLQTELGQATGVELETLIEQTDNYCNCTPQVLVKVSTTSS